MEKTYKLEPRQREVLADMLRQAKSAEREKLQAAQNVSSKDILRDLAVENGGEKLVREFEEAQQKIRTLQEAARAAESKLEEIGFDWNSSSGFTLKWNANKISTEFEKRLKKLNEPIEEAVRKYERAIANLWIAETNADAKAIVDALI
jgi:hypothetical protein